MMLAGNSLAVRSRKSAVATISSIVSAGQQLSGNKTDTMRAVACRKLLSLLAKALSLQELPTFGNRQAKPDCISCYVPAMFNTADPFLDICIPYTYIIAVDAEWDPAKARSNFARHGINFTDAATVLNCELAISIPDLGLVGEERFVTVGADALGRILVVSYTYRRNRVRIISARRATRSERKEYGKGIRL